MLTPLFLLFARSSFHRRQPALSPRLSVYAPLRDLGGTTKSHLLRHSTQRQLASVGESSRRLTLEEEGSLARLAQREITLQKVRYRLFRSLGRTPTADEWARAALGDSGSATQLAKVRREARAAKTALVRANGGLVVAVARGYQASSGRGRSEPLDDLVQEGTLGLIRAVEKYDAARGLRFSTYATAWVRASISAWMKRGDSLIRVPDRVRDMGAKAYRASVTMSEDLGRDPTSSEVAETIGATKKAVEAAVASVAGARTVSLDAKARERSLVDCIADDDCAVPGGDLKTDLTVALSAILAEKELRVVRLRYGLDDGTLRSTRECAAILGIGKESVRQICLKAFRKLRGTPQGAVLLDYMD